MPYTYKRYNIVISKIKGWHCGNCGEVEFDAGEGGRFAEAINQLAKEVDAKEATELARIRKKLKLTHLLSNKPHYSQGEGPMHFPVTSAVRPNHFNQLPICLNFLIIIQNCLMKYKKMGSGLRYCSYCHR